jgi:hypothetical protein
LECPENINLFFPNAPFESANDHLEVDPSNDHLHLDENIDHIDFLNSTINYLDDIFAALILAQNLMYSIPQPQSFNHSISWTYSVKVI